MFDYLMAIVEYLMEWHDVLGIMAGMFIASSILPLPSEAILVYAGVVGISSLEIAIFGGIGSSFGALVGYYFGKSGGSFIKRYGKYLFIDKRSTEFVESWFRRWGDLATLIARVVPFVPYKIFSIGSGFGNMRVRNFFIFTLAGSIPRCFLLSSFGYLVSLTKNTILVVTSLALFFLLPIFVERFLKRG